MERCDLSAIILAGGRSSRMGQDKALLKVGGVTLLERTIWVLRTLSDEILIVGRPQLTLSESPAGGCLSPEFRFLADKIPDGGPLAGLHAGLEEAHARYVVCVACDMPYLQAPALQLLARSVSGFDAAIPCIDGRSQPLHAVYARSSADTLARLLAAGERRVRSFLNELNVRWIEDGELRNVDPELRSIQNVNTPEEWAPVPAGNLEEDSLTRAEAYQDSTAR